MERNAKSFMKISVITTVMKCVVLWRMKKFRDCAVLSTLPHWTNPSRCDPARPLAVSGSIWWSALTQEIPKI